MTAKTVLIADDTAFVRERFGAALGDAGHRAVLAGTVADVLVAGARARRAARSARHRPAAAAVEGRRAGAGDPAGVSRVPILVFSGTIANADEVRQLTDLGVTGFINEYTTPTHILPALAPHLFPDSFNRRSSPRVALSITVSLSGRFDDRLGASAPT